MHGQALWLLASVLASLSYGDKVLHIKGHIEGDIEGELRIMQTGKAEVQRGLTTEVVMDACTALKSNYTKQYFRAVKTNTPQAPMPVKSLPTVLPSVPRLVVTADLHGDFITACAILVNADVVNLRGDWVHGTNTFVQTGDVVDRGPDGPVILEFLYGLREKAEKAGGNVVLLMGNHESMNLHGHDVYISSLEKKLYHNINVEAIGEDGSYTDTKGAKAKGTAAERWHPESGIIGRQVMAHTKAAVIVGNILFIHGGLTEAMVQTAARKRNETRRSILNNMDRLVKKGILKTLRPGAHPTHQELTMLEGDDCPYWTRVISASRNHTGPECKMLQRAMAFLSVDHVVVGHTVTQKFDIDFRCGRKHVMLDTAGSRYMGGVPVFLEIKDDRVWTRWRATPTAPHQDLVFRDRKVVLSRKPFPTPDDEL